MCQAFSCLITKSKKVYWKAGVDSHDSLQAMFVKKDKELKDELMPPNNTFARIEITPKDENYLNLKQKWVYKIDEKVKPLWLDKSYEKPCRVEFENWKKEVYQFNLEEAKNPIHPFKIKAKVTDKDIELLKLWGSVWGSVLGSVGGSVLGSVWGSVWGSVRDSVGGSVWDSVGGSVRDSVGGSVRDSVRDSVGGSVWDSVWGSVGDSVRVYIGSLFPNITKWKYIDYRKKPFNQMKDKYPFYPASTLWRNGLVPVYFDNAWRLYGSPNGDGKCQELYKESK